MMINPTPDQSHQLSKELLKEYAENPKRIWLQDFFIQRMISKRQIKLLCDQSEDFAEAYSLCLDIQESRLFKIGLSGKSGTQAVVALALKNMAGWKNEPNTEPEDKKPAVIVMRPHRLAESDEDI